MITSLSAESYLIPGSDPHGRARAKRSEVSCRMTLGIRTLGISKGVDLSGYHTIPTSTIAVFCASFLLGFRTHFGSLLRTGWNVDVATSRRKCGCDLTGSA